MSRVWRPTETQLKVLRMVRRDGDPYRDCRGMNNFGGRTTVIYSLVRRELMKSSGGGLYNLTLAGDALLGPDEPEPTENARSREDVGSLYVWSE